MTIKCIAIDDEPPALRLVQEYCSRIPYVNLIASFTDPFEAIQFAKSEKPDLLFLDINIPGIDGLQIIKSLEYNPLVIFSTAYSRYAVEGFELDALDFLLKPYSFERFEKAVVKAQKSLAQNVTIPKANEEDFIVVKIEYQSVKIPISSIIYIEALDNYIKIYTKERFFMTLLNLKAITTKLPEGKFVRVHKSYIVGLSHILHFTHENISLGKYTIPIGRSYLQGFLASLKH